jgi:hypothetical protein
MKKSFVNENPALQFITNPEEAEIEKGQQLTPPEGYKVNPLYVEAKTRRVQLVLQPSLYEIIKEKAWQSRVSVNEYCHRVLWESVKENNT